MASIDGDRSSQLGEYMTRWGKEFVVQHFTKVTEQALIRIVLPTTKTETASSAWSMAVADHPLVCKDPVTAAL